MIYGPPRAVVDIIRGTRYKVPLGGSSRFFLILCSLDLFLIPESDRIEGPAYCRLGAFSHFSIYLACFVICIHSSVIFCKKG